METEKSLGPCPKCGSTDRQSGKVTAGEIAPVKFDADTLRHISDSGPVRAVVCNDCKFLELYVA
jgi:predicted nucleic-acid-binding Zn-ribbon protein